MAGIPGTVSSIIATTFTIINAIRNTSNILLSFLYS
ncbi:hypothetical protein MGSAQ_001646 [marine sediment metagenome]|uniref:Uncharacterized protein n=1 Tax=marine sediment metagenome TaxID=412755 RepID=A0A1B6NU40_9ZZZZ